MFRKLFGSMFTGCALAWTISCLRWCFVDKGVVRMSDSVYLFGALFGIIWFTACLWFWLNPLHPKNWK